SGLFTIIGVAAGAVGAVALAPVALSMAGFTSAGGIAAGSYAASMMSAAAVANGGGIAAGSVVAALQAAGESHIRKKQQLFNQFNNSDLCRGQMHKLLQLTTECMSSGAAGISLAGQVVVGAAGAAVGAAASMASNCTL
uniref:Interferon alpha inducible protein 45 n=1 Tax=Sinocyclocheilus anshuiensis TaxID=1608454 RepID=A0A671LDD5_9TELE